MYPSSPLKLIDSVRRYRQEVQYDTTDQNVSGLGSGSISATVLCSRVIAQLCRQLPFAVVSRCNSSSPRSGPISVRTLWPVKGSRSGLYKRRSCNMRGGVLPVIAGHFVNIYSDTLQLKLTSSQLRPHDFLMMMMLSSGILDLNGDPGILNIQCPKTCSPALLEAQVIKVLCFGRYS